MLDQKTSFVSVADKDHSSWMPYFDPSKVLSLMEANDNHAEEHTV